MSAENLQKALEKHAAGKGQYASVTAEDVVAVARTVPQPDAITAALLQGASAVGPGKTVHQKVDDLQHMLRAAGLNATVGDVKPIDAPMTNLKPGKT